MSDKVIKLDVDRESDVTAKRVLSRLGNKEIKALSNYMTNKFLDELTQGLEGEIEYKDSPFFAFVDKLYKQYDAPPNGCYFCDKTIDGNLKPFNFPKETKLCMSCMLKVANVLVAFSINPGTLFPGMEDRKIQPVLFEEKAALIKPSDN